MRVEWTREARQDRRVILDYILGENPRAAIALNDRFSKRAEELANYPRAGRPGRVRGTRELVVHPNYIIVYDLAGESIRILHLLHAAQLWP